jgi:hypothetical protein
MTLHFVAVIPRAVAVLSAFGVESMVTTHTRLLQVSAIVSRLSRGSTSGWLSRGEGRKCCGRRLRDPHVVVLVETGDPNRSNHLCTRHQRGTATQSHES